MAILLRSDTRLTPILSPVEKRAGAAFSAINRVRSATTSRLWHPPRTRSSKQFLSCRSGLHRVYIFSDNFARSSRECPDKLLACVDTFLRWFFFFSLFQAAPTQRRALPAWRRDIVRPRRCKHRFSSATRKTADWFVWKPEPFILGARGKCAGTIRRRKGTCFSSTARRPGFTFPPITPRHGSRRRKAPTGVRRWRCLSAI